jgi:hypothetical protein
LTWSGSLKRLYILFQKNICTLFLLLLLLENYLNFLFKIFWLIIINYDFSGPTRRSYNVSHHIKISVTPIIIGLCFNIINSKLRGKTDQYVSSPDYLGMRSLTILNIVVTPPEGLEGNCTIVQLLKGGLEPSMDGVTILESLQILLEWLITPTPSQRVNELLVHSNHNL